MDCKPKAEYKSWSFFASFLIIGWLKPSTDCLHYVALHIYSSAPQQKASITASPIPIVHLDHGTLTISWLDVFGSAQNPPQKLNSSAPRLDPLPGCTRIPFCPSKSRRPWTRDKNEPRQPQKLLQPSVHAENEWLKLPRKHQQVRQTDLHESKNTGGDSVILHRTLHLCFDSSTIIFLQTGGCFPNLVTWSFQIQTKDLGLTFLLDWTLRFLWVSPSLVGIHGAVPQPHFFEGNMVVPLGWYPSCLTPQGAL